LLKWKRARPIERQLEVRPTALRDLVSIYKYTESTWGYEQARKYLSEIDAAMVMLARGRRSGRKTNIGRFRKLSVNVHFIVFRITRSHITVTRIVHQRMDLPRQLSRR